MNKNSYNLIKIFYVIPVALSIGAVTNIVLFFTVAFLFAGADGGQWVRSYFGGDGEYFMAGTSIIAIVVFPFIIKLNIVLSKK
jgi:hypothetical protein